MIKFYELKNQRIEWISIFIITILSILFSTWDYIENDNYSLFLLTSLAGIIVSIADFKTSKNSDLNTEQI